MHALDIPTSLKKIQKLAKETSLEIDSHRKKSSAIIKAIGDPLNESVASKAEMRSLEKNLSLEINNLKENLPSQSMINDAENQGSEAPDMMDSNVLTRGGR